MININILRTEGKDIGCMEIVYAKIDFFITLVITSQDTRGMVFPLAFVLILINLSLVLTVIVLKGNSKFA